MGKIGFEAVKAVSMVGLRFRHVGRGLWLLVLVVALLWGGVSNLYLLGHFACGDCVPLLAQANHVAPFILLINIPFLLIGLLLRFDYRVVAWLLPGILVFALWYGGQFIPRANQDAEGVELSAAVYNVLGFMADPEQTLAVVEDLDADFIGIVEMRPLLEGKLQTELGERYPYQISKVLQGYDGLALLSRYAIIESTVIVEPYTTDALTPAPNYIRAVVEVEGRDIVLYIFHAPTPQFELLTRYDDRRMHYQIRVMAGMVEHESLPVLFLCDCNSTPQSRQYAVLNRVLNDAFAERGRGFGVTHPEGYRFLRIDYIWHSDEFRTLEARVWNEAGTSDHRPVWARLDLR